MPVRVGCELQLRTAVSRCSQTNAVRLDRALFQRAPRILPSYGRGHPGFSGPYTIGVVKGTASSLPRPGRYILIGRVIAALALQIQLHRAGNRPGMMDSGRSGSTDAG